MAPRASIAMYKALCDGNMAESVTVAAIDQTIADVIDIRSSSFHFGESLNANPISIACFRAMEKGVFVAASAGNDGINGYGTLSNGIPWVTTVGTGTKDLFPLDF